jgi:hypothetical protein
MAIETMMRTVERSDGWWIVQKGWKDYGPFGSESDAEAWGDKHIDDQVFGDPNSFAPELRTRAEEPVVLLFTAGNTAS